LVLKKAARIKTKRINPPPRFFHPRITILQAVDQITWNYFYAIFCWHNIPRSVTYCQVDSMDVYL